MNRHLSGMLFAVGMVFAATGCNLVLNRGVAGNGTIEALAATALSQTAALQTQSAALKSVEAPPPTATVTIQPTSTFTPSVTLTPTLEKVTVTVSKNTNCRQGPDKFFDLVGIMKVGETAEAIGRNNAKTYWVIKLPANTAKTCWLWYEWATLTGNGDALPIIESPPTPTWSPRPDFTFNYLGLTPCSGIYYIRLQVTNTGNVPWETFRVTSEDTVTAVTTMAASNVFLDYNGCAVLAGPEALAPGDTNYAVGIAPAGYSGHNITVNLTLYTENNGGGTPMTGNFNMTMP
jgi:hypothetical protein